MIVSRGTFEKFLDDASSCTELAVDTETTGLYPYKSDLLFSIIIAGIKGVWYLNFNHKYENLPKEYCFGRDDFAILQKRIFDDEKRKYFFHNAKFDLAFLAKDGIECRGIVHDTQSVHRLIDNEAFLKYSLANCAKVAGFEKSDAVEEFIADNNMWEWVEIPGKNRREKNKKYHEVPLDIISSYGLTDGKITYGLGEWQLKTLKEYENEAKNAGVLGYINIYRNETALTKTVFGMERLGVQIDLDYCKNSVGHLQAKASKVEATFKDTTGHEFEVSPKLFADIFKEETLTYGDVTPTGQRNPVFDSDTLATFKHPAAKLVLEYREIKSNLDFFQGFLFYADEQGIIHTNFNQAGTVTGRFSSSNPNLQNLKKDSEESLKQEIVIRRAIVPREDFLFAMFDFDQMEYRLMLDCAGSKTLINKVLGGLDVHQATADLAGITRQQAKTTNFAVLYGSGLATLSKTLRVSEDEARRIRDAIFSSAPEVQELIESHRSIAEDQGYIVNWLGRRCRFPKVKTKNGDMRLSYKAVNSLIQGGCADIVKVAMNKIAGFLQDKKSKLVLTIHDELVIETHKSETGVLPEIKKIMETAYPHKYLPLTVGVEHSYKSLADKVEGLPA